MRINQKVMRTYRAREIHISLEMFPNEQENGRRTRKEWHFSKYACLKSSDFYNHVDASYT